MKTLEKSYNTILKEINALRKQINDSLDQLERNTIKELDTLLATLRTSIKTDIENCTESINNTTFLKEDWLRRKDKSEALSLVMYRKCLDWSINTTAVLQEMTTKNERTLTFNPDTTIQQTLSTLSGLGQILNQMKQSQMDKSTTQNTVIRQDNPKASNTVSSQQHPTRDSNKPSVICDPNQVIRVKSSRNMMNMMNSVKIKSDSNKCCISGICETASGELLISDFGNNNVKLLDQTYKVVAHCNLPNRPMSMCSINLRLVAVALDNSEIQFIKVTNGQLVQDRTLKLQHFCYGIAHHQGNLYITSGTALHHYTVDGRLVSKMFTSGLRAVTKCAVGPDGDRIYVVNSNSKQLITLSRDGTVISSLTDPALKYEYLHVSDSGQVLVCGGYCTTIIQVDRDGRRRLAEVVTVKGGVDIARSVFYSKHTGKLIVGMWNKFNNNDIMVFDTQ